jgi:hypothetical protein
MPRRSGVIALPVLLATVAPGDCSKRRYADQQNVKLPRALSGADHEVPLGLVVVSMSNPGEPRPHDDPVRFAAVSMNPVGLARAVQLITGHRLPLAPGGTPAPGRAIGAPVRQPTGRTNSGSARGRGIG